MRFALEADGALAAGQGIGNMFKAVAMGQSYRDRAAQDAYLSAARSDQAMGAARKSNAEAALKQNELQYASNPMETALLQLGLPTAQADDFKTRLQTGKWGGAYAAPADGVGPTMPAPATDDTVAKLGQSISLLQRMYGTGSNVQQGAEAGLKEQQGRYIDQIAKDPKLAGAIGKAYAATEGKALFDNVGDTGSSIDRFTGEQAVTNEVLNKLFSGESRALANQRNASAENSRKSEGAEGALSTTVLNTLKVPAKDEKGRPVRNPITGELETVIDQEALKSFYGWASSNGKKPTATQFSNWEAQGRPGTNKNPAPADAPPTIVKAPPANERKPNTVYETPKGPMKWTGTGWLPAK